MPSDPEPPEHPIDALLGAYAEQRRKSAPAEPRLHPATRRMLQGEVRRLRPAAVPGAGAVSPGRWARLIAGWPRVAVAGALAVALTLAAWWALPSLTGNPERPGGTLMAKQVAPSRPMPLAPTPTGAPALTAPEAAPAEPTVFQRPRLAAAVDPASSMASPPAPASMPALSAPAASRGRETSEDVKLVRAESAPAAASAPLADRVVRSVDPTLNRGMSTLAPESASASASAVTSVPASAPAVDSGGVGPSAGFAAKGEAGAGMASRRAASGEAVQRFSVAATGEVVRQGLFFNQGAVAGGNGRRPMGRRELAVDAVSAPGAGGVGAGVGAGAGVLARFSVEQQGAMLRLIDGDGSVYEGRLVELVATGPASAFVGAPAVEGADLSREARARGANRGGMAAPGGAGAGAARVDGGGVGLRFEVTGTNRTLGSRVVFSGALQLLTNVTVGELSARPGSADGLTTLSSTPGAAGSAVPAPGGVNGGIQRIQGRVQMDGTNRLDIDAVRVAP